MHLNIKFMIDKFKNKINFENVGNLIAYEQETLDKAKEYLLVTEESEEVAKRF